MFIIRLLVDTVWHTHILFTTDYLKFCNDVSKFFIHHRPQGEYEEHEKQKRYCETIEWLYYNTSSKMDTGIWLYDGYAVNTILGGNNDDSEGLIDIFFKNINGVTR